MKRYNKVTDIEVLKTYYETQNNFYSNGCWVDYISMDYLAAILKTSKYQIQKAYKTLKERGFIKIKEVPTYTADYDNGLYVQDIPILFTKCYVITDKGVEFLERKEVLYE